MARFNLSIDLRITLRISYVTSPFLLSYNEPNGTRKSSELLF